MWHNLVVNIGHDQVTKYLEKIDVQSPSHLAQLLVQVNAI